MVGLATMRTRGRFGRLSKPPSSVVLAVKELPHRRSVLEE